MKKYTILDSTGQKKIVYAPNMKKALRYIGDGEKTVKDSKFYVILSNYDYTKAQAEKDARKYGLKLQILGPANGSKQETEAYLVGPRANIVRMLKETNMDEFEADIEDSVKDSKFYVILSNYDYTKAQAEKDARKYGLKLQILGPANGSKQETEAYLVGPRANIVRMLKETNMDEFEADIEDSVKDSKVKDADTDIVDKLISEEEKAVMDYKEALMADSDLSANAVYAHILAEELEHLRELRSLREQPSLGDSIKDAKWNTYNEVNYKFERNYWHIFSIFNRIEMLDKDVRALARKLNLIVEPYDKYRFKRHNKNDDDVYYDDYRVKGKDKDNVIKFCETLNPLVKPLKFE